MLPPPPASEETGSPAGEQSTTSLARLLTPAEIATLEPIFAQRGATLPAPEHSYIVGTTDSLGNVTAFLVVQLKLHAEPLWIAPGHETAFRPLVREAERILIERVAGNVDVFLFAPAGKVAKMAEVAGMRLEPWMVYSKTVEGKGVVPEAADDKENEAEAASPIDTFPTGREPLVAEAEAAASQEVN